MLVDEPRTKYFFDFEFEPSHLKPISLGIVCEDGREYYAEFWGGFGWTSPFIEKYIKPHLGNVPLKNHLQIRQEIFEFVGETKPQFWAWYGAYDWVLMTIVIGNTDFQHTPENWSKYHMDLKQLSVELNKHELPPKLQPEHHALSDARWNKLVWEFLTNG